MKRIKSSPIYPQKFQPLSKTDLPQDRALVQRKVNGRFEVAQWPDMAIGEEIEIETTNHWIWRGVIEEIRDADNIVVHIIGEKVAMPLPSIVEGQPYILPFMSGDAWSTRPEKGKILMIDGQPYKVTHAPKDQGVGNGYSYKLSPVSQEAYQKRPGRMLIKDLTDPNPSSFRYFGHNIGRIIPSGNEFFHVEEIQRSAYGSGDRTEVFGHNIYGIGHFVPATKAVKLKAIWEAKETVRNLEHSLKVAKQDIDYGGNPDAVSDLEVRLAKARKAAGM